MPMEVPTFCNKMRGNKSFRHNNQPRQCPAILYKSYSTLSVMLEQSVIITNLSASRAGYPLANVKQIEEIPQKVKAKKKLNCAGIRNACRQSQKKKYNLFAPIWR